MLLTRRGSPKSGDAMPAGDSFRPVTSVHYRAAHKSPRELKPLETIEASQALHYRYRDSSQIQFTSQLFPPSAANDCSMRADWGEISDQT